jgi:hypothetical protein
VWESALINIIIVALQLVCYDPHLHITSLDGLANILTLLNIPSMQWRILIPRSGIAEGYIHNGTIRYTVWHCMVHSVALYGTQSGTVRDSVALYGTQCGTIRYTVWHYMVHSVALYDSAKPHFQIRSCHCPCELQKFCKTHILYLR